MKITVSEFAGFCGGVKRAYEMVASIDMEKIKKPVFVLGDLVHNKEVVKRIEEKGIRVVSLKEFKKATSKEIGTLIITAHGDGPHIFKEALGKNINVIDTTCPNVLKVQRLSRAYSQRGNQVILIGDKNHKEVKGIFDWGGKKPIIISNLEEAKKTVIDFEKKTVILSQTTQNSKKVKDICDYFREKFPKKDIEYVNTICLATENRQKELENIAGSFDAVIVIGDKHSANSNRLFEISKQINKKSFFVQKVSQLENINWKNFENILITAGASTPSWLIEKIESRVEKLSS